MFIITAENHAAQFVLREGTIAGLTYRLLRGVAALPSMTAFRAGRYRFQTETVDHTDPELPATAELLALLVAERTEAVQPQAKPATDPPQAPAALRLLIEHEVFAWIVDRWGWGTARVVLLVSCSAAWLAMELMSRWYERQRAAVAGGTPAPILEA